MRPGGLVQTDQPSLCHLYADHICVYCANDAANRLASVNGAPYTWDADGNLANDGSKTYTYTQANRLTGATVVSFERRIIVHVARLILNN